MKREDLEDVHVQDHLRRDLEGKLMMAVFDAVEGGLNPDSAKKAVQSVWDQEQRLAESRVALARTYF